MKKSDVIEIISTVSVVIGLVFVGVQLLRLFRAAEQLQYYSRNTSTA